MQEENEPDAAGVRVPGAMSDRRRERIRLDISREAANLFWQQGVAGTSGEQIADAVGLSVRTLWRYFRNKESCAEPIISRNIDELMEMLRRWPAQLSLEDHLTAQWSERAREPDARRSADDLIAIRMVGLADTEPAIRSAWLMACDRVEQELAVVFAARLRRPVDEAQVRLYAAAAGAVIRVIDEDTSRDLLLGRYERVAPQRMSQRLANAVRVSTGGALGDPVTPR